MVSWLNKVVDPESEKRELAKVAKEKFNLSYEEFIEELNGEFGESMMKPEALIRISGCPFEFYMAHRSSIDQILEDLPILETGHHVHKCKKCQYLICYVNLLHHQQHHDGAH